MNKHTVNSIVLISLGCFFIHPSCTTMHLATTWKDQTFQKAPFHKIVVIGQYKNLKNCESVEDAVVARIKTVGTDSVSSLIYMPPEREFGYDEMHQVSPAYSAFSSEREFRYDDMYQDFKENGIDGILVLKLKGFDRIRSTKRAERDSSIKLFSDNDFYCDGSSSDPMYVLKSDLPIPEDELYDEELLAVQDYKTFEDNPRGGHVPFAEGFLLVAGSRGAGRKSGGQQYEGDKYIITMEGALYSNENGKLVWVAEIKMNVDYLTVDGFTNPEKECPRLAKVIVDALIKDSIIQIK